MKKIFVLSLVIICAFAACCFAAEGKKKIVIGYDINKIPAGYKFEDSTPYKFYIEDACRAMNWAPEFKGVKMSEIETAINKGTIDCYWNCFTYQSREKLYAWTAPYKNSRLVLIAKNRKNVFGNASGFINIGKISNLPTETTIAVSAGTVTARNFTLSQQSILSMLGYLKEFSGLVASKKSSRCRTG